MRSVPNLFKFANIGNAALSDALTGAKAAICEHLHIAEMQVTYRDRPDLQPFSAASC
jgi:hypothetical protein